MPNCPALVSERGRGAGRAEELYHGKACSRGAKPLEMACQLCEPYGQLSSEGDRDGRLRVRSTRHHGGTMSNCPGRDLVSQRSREHVDPIEGTASQQCEARVHDVLRRRPPVHVPGGVRGSIADLLEQGQDRIADHERPRAQSLQVHGLRYCGPLDRSGGLGGKEPERGLRGGKRPFHLEPRSDERPLREDLRDLVVAEPIDQRQEHRLARDRVGDDEVFVRLPAMRVARLDRAVDERAGWLKTFRLKVNRPWPHTSRERATRQMRSYSSDRSYEISERERERRSHHTTLSRGADRSSTSSRRPVTVACGAAGPRSSVNRAERIAEPSTTPCEKPWS